MTYPLVHILCNVLIHIWKEANSQHKYLIRTFYIPTSHVSINCRMYLWAHNLQLCYPQRKLFPSLPLCLLCYHKNRQHKALVRLHFPLINLWKPLQVIPVDHVKHTSQATSRLLISDGSESSGHGFKCREVPSHLPAPPRWETEDAGGHNTPSIKLGVIGHRLLQITQEDVNQCKAKLTQGQKLMKMKQLVQNWIWIPIMINCMAQGVKPCLLALASL